MLKLNLNQKAFEAIEETKLITENILERFDLQKAIVNSWELVRSEIGLPSSYLIGQEIKPHQSTQDSIDLLAFNPDDSSLIVIELKRDRNKLQLLQSLSYAAMVSQWESDELINKIQRDINPEPEELIDLINDSELSEDIKILMLSEYYDPEVILTADWLRRIYSVDISAFSISLNKLGEDIVIHFNQRYPLKELTDVYDVRNKRKEIAKSKTDIDWEDVLPKLKYSFAKKGIDLCKKFRTGDPSRRRFGNVRTNYDGFTWISLNFREKYINVYLKSAEENSEEVLKSKFSDSVVISSWRDGLSVIIETENQFNDLVKWLKLENAT